MDGQIDSWDVGIWELDRTSIDLELEPGTAIVLAHWALPGMGVCDSKAENPDDMAYRKAADPGRPMQRGKTRKARDQDPLQRQVQQCTLPAACCPGTLVLAHVKGTPIVTLTDTPRINLRASDTSTRAATVAPV